MNLYKSADDNWFLLVVTPDKIATVAKGIVREDLLIDPRFSDPAKLATNMGQLTAILDEIFASQPMAHWRDIFDNAHITYGDVKAPSEVINDPQLRENGFIVPLEGAGEKLTSIVSSPIQVHDVAKVSARRAPGLGEHSDEALKELGFEAAQIGALHASGAVPQPKLHASAA
jgi:crotonobetainyl-CoA:carnitine CoA-transferase CaiB-like acyl-CoA transferase